MKRLIPLTLLMFALPAFAAAQSVLQVGSLVGAVEIRPGAEKAFKPLTTSGLVHPGDQIRTGAGASVVLTLPDTSYVVVTENSDLVIRDFSGSSFRSVVNLMLGKVRFYVQRLGGRPNPYRVETPTALIAVRGTIFDVWFDGVSTEVQCLDGQVAVENVAVPNREVILNPSMHTLVMPGQVPTTPVPLGVALPNRTIQVVKVGPGSDRNTVDPRALEDLLRDNDRMSRPTDRPGYPGSQIDPNVGRAKPSPVTFP